MPAKSSDLTVSGKTVTVLAAYTILAKSVAMAPSATPGSSAPVTR